VKNLKKGPPKKKRCKTAVGKEKRGKKTQGTNLTLGAVEEKSEGKVPGRGLREVNLVALWTRSCQFGYRREGTGR